MGEQLPSGRRTTRRNLLKAGLTAGLAAGTTGWHFAPESPGGAPSRVLLRQPGSLPDPRLAPGTDTMPQIKHIVVLMMENHSYDDHLGMLRRPGADGFTLGKNGKPKAVNPYADGRIQLAFRMPTTCQLSGMPSQTWTDSHKQLDRGKLDGFVKSASGPVSMGYWQRDDLPFYYSLASVFPLADRYFCSMLGPTFPNRRYLIAATSIGMISDSVPSLTGYPANGTIFDRLHQAGVSWKDYYARTSVVPTLALFPELLTRYPGNITDVDDFFSDAAAGHLPGFSLVEPNYQLRSEEDPQNIALGKQFAAKVIHAVMNGPGWKNTLLIWTFDEHGGYYDHVVPPRAIAPDDIPPQVNGGPTYTGFRQYGFRVPCVVVSPWARRNYVSHNVFDHTSICALVEKKWNLPAMTRRDANANNMTDMLDFSKAAFAQPPKLQPSLADAHPVKALACSVTGPGTIPPPGSVSPAP
ncbi:MAG TPA: alkaline phosphatase family protein [Streptosporangiaceae bacterium]|nr:alkaline phosphatase family protein [Streptosporangiaceae bacterium]